MRESLKNPIIEEAQMKIPSLGILFQFRFGTVHDSWKFGVLSNLEEKKQTKEAKNQSFT